MLSTSALATDTPGETLGVYVHFPYCLQKCPYCDFLSVKVERPAIPHAAYADAVIAELERRAASVASAPPLRSVFFGGGTPSLWQPSELGRVLATILTLFPSRTATVEVTVECNPSSFDARVAEALRLAGANRISLGVQSLDAERLRFLGRLHDAPQALQAVAVAQQAGFERVSADLIFGVAGQTPADATLEALTLARTGISHLSAYALTIEPGTRFGELSRRGRLPLLTEDSVAESFAAVELALEAEGFCHYEVSNYARGGAEARHNLGYWRGEPYLGVGVGAWGTVSDDAGRVRYRNTPSIERYLALSADAVLPLDEPSALVAVVERLAPEVLVSERLMLGLRLAEGVDLDHTRASCGADVLTPERRRAIAKWVDRGALYLHGNRLGLRKSHWLLADGIISDLM
ncbi:MAG TPA: radical SAM family heme chaperone HemW [Polyangiaceae bacterium]|nr:radical SAM family heme chaperone HemW [Polyangiaceae bacterium]